MLSKRLQAVADMVTKGNIVADIGTDHGYVPIYLVNNNIAPTAFALDINQGPLSRAKENIKREGLEKKINTVLSDGMDKLSPNMVDTAIIAGMGGELIVHILKTSKINNTLKEIILSPHRDIEQVRRYIIDSGWHIIDENMVVDGGKYYTVLKAVHGFEEKPYSAVEYEYGRKLLEDRHPVLEKYLKSQRKKFEKVKSVMEENHSSGLAEIEKILDLNGKGLELYDYSEY